MRALEKDHDFLFPKDLFERSGLKIIKPDEINSEEYPPNNGFGINVAVLPCLRATFLTMYLKIKRLSAHFTS